LRSILVGSALVDRLLGCEIAAFERLRPRKLVVGERHAGGRGLQRRLRLFQPDLVRPGINREEQVALVDDLPVLEMDFGERAADLGPELDPVDRRELAEEAGPGIDLALQGLADCHQRSRGRHRHRLACSAGRKSDVDKQRSKHRRCSDRGRSPGPPARSPRRLVEWFSFKLRMIADLIHEAVH